MTLDLYGSEISSNAANYYATGLKGRFEESKLRTITSSRMTSIRCRNSKADRIVTRMAPALTALNARLRDDYIREIQAGLDRWNRIPDAVRHAVPVRIAAYRFPCAALASLPDTTSALPVK